MNTLPSKRIVIVATLLAFMLVALGLNLPKGGNMAVAQYATSTPVPPPPSADEQREQALGIYRLPGIGGGSNSIGVVNFIWRGAGPLQGSLDFWAAINGVYVQIAFFGPDLVAASATSNVTINGVGPAAGWRTVVGPSALGSNYRSVEIFNSANVSVAKYDIKIN